MSEKTPRITRGMADALSGLLATCERIQDDVFLYKHLPTHLVDIRNSITSLGQSIVMAKIAGMYDDFMQRIYDHLLWLEGLITERLEHSPVVGDCEN